MTSGTAWRQLAGRVLRRLAPGPRPDGELLLVVDAAGWILDEVAHQLLAHLNEPGCRAVSSEWTRARRCTIHLLDRGWAWNDGVFDGVDPSNQLIGVWWHGRLDSPEPIIQAALGRLRAQHTRFARLQVTCSSGRETLEALGVPAGKIVTLPVGVDLAAFGPPRQLSDRLEARRALGLPDNAIAIGCFQKDGVGWNDGSEPKLIKGPDVFVDALVRLHSTHPVHAVIPGPARGYVKERLRDAGVPFSAPGMVPRGELPRLYHALDLYVSPSRDEGGPAGALEAMASGVPVVSTRTGIPADLITSGVNGLLVPVDDVAALVGALDTAISSADLRASMAAAGLKDIQQYDWPLVAGRYVAELYSPLRAAAREPR